MCVTGSTTGSKECKYAREDEKENSMGPVNDNIKKYRDPPNTHAPDIYRCNRLKKCTFIAAIVRGGVHRPREWVPEVRAHL